MLADRDDGEDGYFSFIQTDLLTIHSWTLYSAGTYEALNKLIQYFKNTSALGKKLLRANNFPEESLPGVQHSSMP